MKKILLLILVFCVMFSNVGCSKKSSDVTLVTTGLSFTAEISYDSIKYSCFTEIFDSKKIVFTFENPDEIKGFKVIIDNDKMSIEYAGLSHNSNDTFLEFTPFDMIYKIFKSATNNENLKFDKDKSMILSSVDSVDYTIKIGQTGMPIEIKCPSKRLLVLMKNCTIM